MDLEKIKAQIADIKDKVIDNVDRNFNDYILEDIYDSGELNIIDKPIDELDWYWYWKEQSLDLRTILYQLLQKGYDKTLSEILNECMELKKVIDKSLLSNEHYSYNDLMDWYGVKGDEQGKRFIHLNKGNQNVRIIESLHNSLFDMGLIEDNFSNFSLLFSSYQEAPSPIKWLGTELQIVALFNLLADFNIIPKTQKYRTNSLIASHFINKWGNPFKEKQLSVVKSRVNDKEKDAYSEISEIVEKLAQIN